MRNIKLVIQYDGTKYKGWQKQNVKGHEAVTIQDKFEKILSKMLNEEIQVIGCGRTDAGVHADNYIGNFKCNATKSLKEFKEYLTMYLPEDIVVKSVSECNERFHSRLNVKSKTYTYTIDNHQYCDVFNKRFAYHVQEKLDINKMIEGSKELIGTHDFQSFTNLKPKNGKSTVRTITDIEITAENNIIKIRYSGNGFLLNMVRIITGTLIDVGTSKITPVEVSRILESKSRSEGGFKVPAKGLCMEKIEY